MLSNPTLVSFDLCPYVQRAAIVLAEKGIPFTRRDVDLADKPDWFSRISPLGKVPLLIVGDDVLCESSVIVEFFEETTPKPLHPADPLLRARHRAWMEFGSSIWRLALAARPSEIAAVRPDYIDLLHAFLRKQNGAVLARAGWPHT